MDLVKKYPFFHLFLGNIGLEQVFYNNRERKNAFVSCKNKKLKKSNNRDFSKGDKPWFS